MEETSNTHTHGDYDDSECVYLYSVKSCFRIAVMTWLMVDGGVE